MLTMNGRVVFLLALICFLALCTQAFGATWPMKQRDLCNTGRADYIIPQDRMNSYLLDIFRWQTPSPGSPNDGDFSSTQMTFFDGAGPGGADIVVGGYHWPKGVQGMDRHTGKTFWYGNPAGGETIGTIAPAFSNDGQTIYVVNDATAGGAYPNGHPLMAFHTTVGPSVYWHNGSDPNPSALSMGSPKIAPDGRIFMHSWVDRPYAGTDTGSSITMTWAAATGANCGLSDPALYNDGGLLRVFIGARDGRVICYDGSTGAELWSVNLGTGSIDTSVTVDPASGNVYVGAGDGSVYVIGLTKTGYPLWNPLTNPVYQYINGVNSRQCVRGTGCLSWDGSTYYFQTNSLSGDGSLYAINTEDGSVKWSYQTMSTGWEFVSSSPIVTKNGVIIIGNNYGNTFYALRDDGTHATLIDMIECESGGNARASASIAPDGSLYLPLRTIWTTPNGNGQTPTFQVANVFSCIDLRSEAVATLSPPPHQGGIALNNAVSVFWKPIVDTTGQFHHYAVYRSTSPFTSVQGMTPIATVMGISSTGYLDSTAANGVRYYYAVTSVTITGNEVKTINSFGPLTPHDETDLQVVTISRTPRYPRYLPIYTYYSVTEPSGFGPYWFSAATGLGGGQTGSTQRWPNVGDTVTYTATVRNRGTNTWSGTLSGTWRVDGGVVANPSKSVTLAPGATTTFSLARTWDGGLHDIRFTINVIDARPANNTLSVNTKSVGFLTYADVSKIEQFRENTSTSYPQAKTDDLFDWLNAHMARFNELFAAANCQKRVHYEILQALTDGDPDPTIDRTPFAIFPFRYYATDGDPRGSGYYNPADDIDYGLLHEEGHQLGLIDLYQLDVPPEANQVSGQGYSAITDLMHGCSPIISEFSALAMNHWLDKAHGYYGQYMYNLPATIQLRLLGFDGQPLRGASVTVYQLCERPGIGKLITNQIKAEGSTDSSGIFVLPNVPIDPGMVPPAYTGDTLHDNPFGYLAVVGTNGLLHFKVEYNGGIDYCWLDVTEAMVAYFRGQTTVATFDRQLALGGTVQHWPPDDMAELNANDWAAWAQGSSPENTYVVDDTSRRIVGAGSVKFVTDGGFDTYVRYPRTFTAQWDLRAASTLNISFYAVNPNIGFQNGSPWIRLKDALGNYYQYQYYVNGSPYDLLNQARGVWRSYQIPLNAPENPWTGWGRTSFGTPDLSHINSLEIHADTWDAGFQLWLDGVSFTFTGGAPITSISDLKAAPDGSRVDIPSSIVSAAWPDSFYIERPDRACGIRVEKASHGLIEGREARVIGLLGTNSNGERLIDASWTEWLGGTGSILPIYLGELHLGGGAFGLQQGVRFGVGLNNIGVLVRTWGKVVSAEGNSFAIEDGSSFADPEADPPYSPVPIQVKVLCPDGVTPPAVGQYVVVTGISSCEMRPDGKLDRLLRIRRTEDIHVLQ